MVGQQRNQQCRATGVQVGGPHHLSAVGNIQHSRDQHEQISLVVGASLGRHTRPDDDAVVRSLPESIPARGHETPHIAYRRVLLERQPRRHVLTQRSVRASLNERSCYQQDSRAATPSEPSPTTTAPVRQGDLSHTRLSQETIRTLRGPEITHA